MHAVIRSLLVEVSPNMHDPYHREDNDPSKKGTHSSPVQFLVEDHIADEERTKDLRCPVHEIVQSTRTDGKNGSVVIVEFCVIPKIERINGKRSQM